MDGAFTSAAGPDPIAELRGYWEALRGPDGAVPLRSAIDPRGIAGALDCAFIAERVAPRVARFRLAGSAIADLMGMDVRGMPMLALIDPPSRADFGAAVETALTAPAILDMSLSAERGIGRPALSGRLVLLPLRRADGGDGLALGALALAGATGRPPRRFAIERRSLTPVGLGPVARAPEHRAPPAAGPRATARPAGEPLPALAEAPARFLARGERPYLRLVRT